MGADIVGENTRTSLGWETMAGKADDHAHADGYPDREPGGPRKASIAASARSKPVAP